MELRGRLQTAHEIARRKIIATKENSKKYFDTKVNEIDIKVGDKILLYDETVRRGRSKKLRNKWIRPYEVIGVEKVNPVIKKGRRVQKVHFH
jgi:hypothetical protein